MSHDGSQYDRLPATSADREVDGRASRAEVIEYFANRFGMSPATFESVTFWEKGRGKVWAFHGEHSSPLTVEALGIHLLRTHGRHWKPTTDGMQCFGRAATENVIRLDRRCCQRFWRGKDQLLEATADPGYVIVANELGGRAEPLGVGLYLHGTLESVVPKGRRESIPD